MGLVSLVQQAPISFLEAWAAVVPRIYETFGSAGGQAFRDAVTFTGGRQYEFQEALALARASLPDVAREALPVFSDLVAGEGAGSTRLGDLVAHAALKTLLHVLPNDIARARVLSAGGAGAGAWLTALPVHPGLALQPAHFTVALILRLGLPQPCLRGVPLCACGAQLVPGGESLHVLRCPTGGGLTRVHNTVRDQLAVLARQAGYVVKLEPEGAMPLRPGEAKGRRPDILCQDMLRAGRLFLDVTIVDPLQPAVVSGAATVSGMAAAMQANTKRRIYSDPFPGDTFIPLPIEVFGALGRDCDMFLRKLAGGGLAPNLFRGSRVGSSLWQGGVRLQTAT